MSQPEKFICFGVHIHSPNIEKNAWVRYADYAALAAENERLRKASFVTAVPAEQYERVIKAGDAVTLCLCADTAEQHKRRCAVNWLAAKEGRDAK